jgi:putative heme-binding domain-containing protein
MRSLAVAAVLFALALVGGTSSGQKKGPAYPPSPHIAPTDPRPPAEERKGFHLPPGFEVQLVAAEPDVRKPINLAFDARGRLWVTQSVEYPFAAKEGRKPRDCVKVLEDFGPDGRARKVTTFAGGLNIPIGVLPVPGGALVYSIPNVYRLLDTDGDGKADRREVLLGPYGHRDTHGMTGEFTLGFDGLVYACHGYANTSTVKGRDGSQITMQSGNTYRFRPDGTRLEYFTHGQVNPFGLSWDPLGNLYSCDCHSQPIYQLLRGGWYPSFGKPHDGLGFAPEMFTNYRDSTAIAGIAYYAADHFPAGYRDAAYIGDVVTSRIVQFDVAWHGASPRASMRYLLKSDDPWFRPVSIVLGPDGALYVADFYNRIIGHYEVPLKHPGRDRERGRIWRIIYTGKDGKGRPRAPRADWTRATTAQLIEDLAHPNLTVRLLATHQLAERGKAAPAAVRSVMKPSASPFQRMHGLWVLQRCDSLDDATLTAAARDRDRGVRVHAMRVLETRKLLPQPLWQLALDGLKDRDPLVRRCAAAALGSHPAAANVRPLLALRRGVPAEDTHLLHVVRMALRDQLLPPSTWKDLRAVKWNEADSRAVADVCPGVPTPAAALFLLDHVRRLGETGDTLYRYVHHIARYAPAGSGPALLAFASGNRPPDLLHQRALFLAVQQGTQERGAALDPGVRTWGERITRDLLGSSRANEFAAGIELAGVVKAGGVARLLRSTAADRRQPVLRRVAALNALAAIDPRQAIPPVARLLAAGGEPIPLREQAAGLLARLNLPEARAELVKTLQDAPARLQNAIAAELARSRPGAEALLAAVSAGKASARVLREKVVELRLAEIKLPQFKQRLARLTAGLPSADSKLLDLIKEKRAGFLKARPEAARGAVVFEKNCANCHIIAGKGAKIGPQLDGVGIRGLDRLLEDVLDPNRNVDQAFRLTRLILKNGQERSGLLLKEEGEVLVLADDKGKEVRVPKKQVDEKVVSQQSPMPANFAELPEKDFYDLMAYLLTQRVPQEGRSK